jgi:formamidopyrimidine-DNA glycosylase
MYDHRLRWSVPRWLPARVAGRTIDALERRSKYLLFRLSTDTLLVHFGMTGSLRAFHDAAPRRPHDHVDIVLDSGVTLRYHDPRRFGAMLWLSGPSSASAVVRARSRAVRPACNADYLWRASRRRKAAIKLALMDNHLVVGIGNIYANESLFRAGIRPTTPRISRLPRSLGPARRRIPRDA